MLKKFQIVMSLLLISTGSSFAVSNQSKETLGKYFNANQIKEINSYKADYEKKIPSAKALADMYRKAGKLVTGLNTNLEKIQSPDLNKFNWMKKSFPGLELTYGAEAQSIYLTQNFKEYLKKAKLTPEASDDAFFSLMIGIYGEVGQNFPNWFTMTWDYGGYTLLGKGTHIKALEKISTVMLKSPEFKTEIATVKDELIGDILNSNNFSTPKANVVKEINQIINSKYTSASEKKSLSNRIKEFDKTPKNFQFNCEKAQCAYG